MPEPVRRRVHVDRESNGPGDRSNDLWRLCRAALEAKHGQVWDTDQLRDEFEVIGFMAPPSGHLSVVKETKKIRRLLATTLGHGVDLRGISSIDPRMSVRLAGFVPE